MKKTVTEIAELIGGTVYGDGNISIEGVTNIAHLQKGFITP